MNCKILLSVKNISATLKETVYNVSSKKKIIIHLLIILFFLLRLTNVHKYKQLLLISPSPLTDQHLIVTLLHIFQPKCSKHFIKALKIVNLIYGECHRGKAMFAKLLHKSVTESRAELTPLWSYLPVPVIFFQHEVERQRWYMKLHKINQRSPHPHSVHHRSSPTNPKTGKINVS